MGRQGLVDDSGHNFEPTISEEMAWEAGYQQGKIDAIDKFWKEFDKQIKSNGKQTYFYTEFLRLGMNLAEQVKEQKNED